MHGCHGCQQVAEPVVHIWEEKDIGDVIIVTSFKKGASLACFYSLFLATSSFQLTFCRSGIKFQPMTSILQNQDELNLSSHYYDWEEGK